MASTSEKSVDLIRSELLSGVGGLARSASRVLRWQACLKWLALGVALLVLLLVSDMWLRREELGLRVLSALTWCAALAAGAYYWLRPAWRFSPTPVEVARWIERSRPELGEQLSTAVELASVPVDDNRFGSPGFRDCVLRQWSTQGVALDWQQYLDARGLRHAALLIAGLLFVLAGLWWMRPEDTQVAFQRLTMPWSVVRWPQRDQLAIHNPPTVVAVGSELQLEIIDRRPPLPDRVEVHTRPVDANRQSASLSKLETIQVDDVAIGNLPPLTKSVEVSAVGGDDRGTAWHRIEVVQPPELSEYRFLVTPPAYTNLPSAEVVGHRIAVLAGSQVSFQGNFSEPIKQVKAVVSEESVEWSARTGDGERSVHIGDASAEPVQIQQSFSWQLSVVTVSGLELQLPQRWHIEVTEDAPPQVIMKGSELAELSADALLALGGRATDDLGLESMVARLRPQGDDSTEPFTLPIWSANSKQEADANSDQPVRELEVEATWNLAKNMQLRTGQRISVWLEALDSAGQWGRSEASEYSIRDAQELVQSIQQRQDQLLNKVRELVDTQHRNRQLFSRAAELAQQPGPIDRGQLDLYRNVAQVQRAILRQFSAAEPQGGLIQDVDKLRQLLAQNRLESSELAHELAALQTTIASLESNELRSASQASEQSLQQAQALQAQSDSDSNTSKLAELNDRTGQAQDHALRGLESLLDRLARNESLQQVQHELAQILNQQNAVRRETDQLQLNRLSGSEDEPPRAAQAALVADQQGLARRVDDLVRRADELRAAVSPDQQSLKAQLERAIETLVNSQTSGKMRQSTDELRAEKFAQAAATQQEVAQLLEQTLQQLGAANRSQLGSLQNRAESLRQTGQSLAQLAEEQSQLSAQWSDAGATRQNDQLLSQQSQVKERTQSQADAANAGGDSNLSSQLQNALSEQQLAQQAGQQQSFQQAGQAAGRAAEQLKQSAQQMQQRAAQLEQQVAEQQMFELITALQQLSQQQRPISEQFAQLPEPTDDEERQSRQQVINQTAQQQEAVRQNLRDLRTKTSELPTFDWTLQQAETSMSRAVAAAQRYRLRPDAQLAAAEALRLLDLALAAMQQDGPKNQTSPSDDAHAPTEEQQSASHPVPMIASLKLLRSLQLEINQRTTATEALPDSSRRSQRLSELSEMQQALGVQIEQLLREFAAANDTGEN